MFAPDERDRGQRSGLSCHEREQMKAPVHTLDERRPAKCTLIHQSDRDSQYPSIHYSERLSTAKIAPSVGMWVIPAAKP